MLRHTFESLIDGSQQRRMFAKSRVALGSSPLFLPAATFCAKHSLTYQQCQRTTRNYPSSNFIKHPSAGRKGIRNVLPTLLLDPTRKYLWMCLEMFQSIILGSSLTLSLVPFKCKKITRERERIWRSQKTFPMATIATISSHLILHIWNILQQLLYLENLSACKTQA